MVWDERGFSEVGADWRTAASGWAQVTSMGEGQRWRARAARLAIQVLTVAVQGGALATLLDGCGGRVELSGDDQATGHGGGAAGAAGGTAGAGGTSAGGAAPACIVQVSAGAWHTCAVKADGALWCWGLNAWGEIGDGTTELRPSPVRVTALGETVSAVSAGRIFTCAVKRDGTLWCWGFNGCGQLGVGSVTETELAPLQVSALGSVVAEVAAGGCHTCARARDRRLWCWGYNDRGQLGNGTFEHSATPVSVDGDDASFEQVAAGETHTCAVKADGSLWCWGQNEQGELGLGTTDPDPPFGKSTPQAVVTLGRAVASVATGSWFTCARQVDSTVWSWGGNWAGQLGVGNFDTPLSLPQWVRGVGSAVAGIAAGGWHGCACDAAGQAWCWGRNERGQVGLGDSSVDVSSPVAVAGVDGMVVQVTAGDRHTCVRTAEEAIWCWGDNEHGQLGNGSTAVSQPTPTRVLLECPPP